MNVGLLVGAYKTVISIELTILHVANTWVNHCLYCCIPSMRVNKVFTLPASHWHVSNELQEGIAPALTNEDCKEVMSPSEGYEDFEGQFIFNSSICMGNKEGGTPNACNVCISSAAMSWLQFKTGSCSCHSKCTNCHQLFFLWYYEH